MSEFDINMYLIDTLKMNSLDWLIQNIEPPKKKINIDMDTVYSLFLEAYNEANAKNTNRVLDIMNHVYDLELIDDTFYTMINNLLIDEDYNQVRNAINSYLFTI